ncbi:helix-turn-helix domain-containing protein [Pseudonocardia parietis]|uniref:Transcriptional regulator with XRE-family HTH domain n=1 Tax=Pseudonocardia parietis TaxID=570936 RepID=A0ABS4VYV7_9PSEU|nr:helix-turn-helix transcriptional regulator [Pseudonocardia parietis]MBP2369134.1 transcriptional regulator with XRE-family HTH domain [Pseudonocardia parietis]
MSRAHRGPETNGARRNGDRAAGAAASAASAAGELRDAGRQVAEDAWSAQVNALGGFIRSQRQMAKLSLREMAAMTKVSNAYLSQVERGLHQPSLKVLRSIADALHLNTDQMLSRAGWSVRDDEPEVPAGGAPEPAEAPAPPGVEVAIAADARLSDEQKAALLGVYRSFVERS